MMAASLTRRINARNARERKLSRKRKCSNCTSLEEQSMYINVCIDEKADIPSHGERIVLPGEADQTPDQEPGDVVFVLDEKEHDVFKRSGADLSANIQITLQEALCGFSRVVIRHLDGRGIHLTHKKPEHGVLKPMQVIRVDNEGMPIKKSDARGHLYLIIEIKFPENDWMEDESVQAKLTELLPKPDPPIGAEMVDEHDHESDADIEEFGVSENGVDGQAWEDEDDDDDGQGGPQCQQQ